MWETEVDHFVEALGHVFPANASIQRRPPFDTVSFKVDWPLHTDPHRPNKRSRLITVCLSRKFMADYVESPLTTQTSETKRVIEHITAKLAQFEPNHDSPSNALPPEEKWDF